MTRPTSSSGFLRNPVLIFQAGIVLSIGLWFYLADVEEQKIVTAFRDAANHRYHLIAQEIKRREDDFRVFRSFYRSSDEVTRDEFHTFFKDYVATQRALVAVDWAPRITARERESFEDRLGREITAYDSDGNLIPREDVEIYYPIEFSMSSRKLMDMSGFDHFSQPDARVAMARAVRSGEYISSHHKHLTRLGEREVRSTHFAIFMPVYDEEKDPLGKVLLPIEGFLIGYFDTRLMLEELQRSIPGDGLETHFIALSSSNDAKVKIHHDHDSDFIVLKTINIANRPWEISFHVTENYRRITGSRFPESALIFGLLLTLLSAVYAYSVRRGTVELLSSKERLASATSIAEIGIWKWDIKRNILIWDDLMYKIYGVSKADFKGAYEAWESCLLEEDRENSATTLSNAVAGNSRLFEDVFRIRRPDTGEIRYIKAHGEVSYSEDGEPERMIGTNMDISTLKEAENILRERSEEAERASEAKSQFLANMSHEVRTPLTSIIGYSELLKDDELTFAEKVDAVNSLYSNSKHLLLLVDHVLDMSKLEAGKMTVDFGEIDFFPFLKDVSRALKVTAEEKGLQFSLNFEFPLPEKIFTDVTKLRQILFNLGYNAIKFTERGEVIVSVSFDQSNNFLDIDVVDTGIGMTEEQQSRLFQVFTQADESTSRKFGGTGLGLALSQELAHKIGGDITLESSIGIGSTFSLTVPAIAESSEDVPRNLTLLTEEPDIVTETSLGKRIAFQGNVLLIEDSPETQKYLSILLRKLGLRVEVCGSAALASEKLESQEFDLLLLDMHLPETDGEYFSKELRERGIVKPIIALSADARKERVEAYLSAGCSDFLGKPFSKSQFVNKLLHYLKVAPNGAGQQVDVDDEGVQVPFEETARAFIDSIAERLSEVEKQVDERQLETARRLCHKLAGAAAFAYPELYGPLRDLYEVVLHDERVEEFGATLKDVRNLHAVALVRLDDKSVSTLGQGKA